MAQPPDRIGRVLAQAVQDAHRGGVHGRAVAAGQRMVGKVRSYEARGVVVLGGRAQHRRGTGRQAPELDRLVAVARQGVEGLRLRRDREHRDAHQLAPADRPLCEERPDHGVPPTS